MRLCKVPDLLTSSCFSFTTHPPKLLLSNHISRPACRKRKIKHSLSTVEIGLRMDVFRTCDWLKYFVNSDKKQGGLESSFFHLFMTSYHHLLLYLNSDALSLRPSFLKT